MKFICEQSTLLGAVSTVSRSVSPKSNLAVLEGIRIRADEDLHLTGYNMETGVTVTTQARVLEPGDCVFPTRMFFDIIRKLSSEEVVVSVNEQYKAEVDGGESHFRFTVSSADDYPDLPEVDAAQAVQVPQADFRDLINGTIFAVSENQAKPIHTGCLVEIEENLITMVALDGFQLARRCYHAEQPFGQELKFVVPSAALKELEKILTEDEETMELLADRRYILFRVGSTVLVSRLLEGSFLEWRRYVPTDSPNRLIANVAALSSTVERVGLIVSEKFKSPVRCRFGNGFVDLKTVTTVASAHDVCPLNGDGRDVEIGLNCRFLLNALRAVPSAEVTLEFTNGLSPIVLTPCEDKYDFSYMILPVRLQNN